MAKSNSKALIRCDLKTVWGLVTALDNYAWRSDLSRIEILDQNTFVEYTRDGYPTTFTITCMEPCKRWEFHMENGNMQGHWVGLFTETEEGTALDFTEDVRVKKWLMRPFVPAYLKKQQARYIADLKRALEK